MHTHMCICPGRWFISIECRTCHATSKRAGGRRRETVRGGVRRKTNLIPCLPACLGFFWLRGEQGLKNRSQGGQRGRKRGHARVEWEEPEVWRKWWQERGPGEREESRQVIGGLQWNSSQLAVQVALRRKPPPLELWLLFCQQMAFFVSFHQWEQIAQIHNASSYLTLGNLFIMHLNSVRLEKQEVRDGQLAKKQLWRRSNKYSWNQVGLWENSWIYTNALKRQTEEATAPKEREGRKDGVISGFVLLTSWC